MDANQIVQAMGGRAAVIQITGLTRGRIAQWVANNQIPRAWLQAFHAMKPTEIPAPEVPLASKAPDAQQPTGRQDGNRA